LLYQLLYGVSILLAIALGLRWVVELLAPVLPLLIALLLLAVIGRLAWVWWWHR
jgi:hypothetical protein